MSKNLINELNAFKTFRFDKDLKRIINMRFQDDTSIEEFLSIQNVLDNFKMRYRFDKNFDIQVL